MAFEVVKEIANIEMQGEKLVNDARQQAKNEEKDAIDKYNKIIENAKKEAEKCYDERISYYEKEADKFIKPTLEKNEKAVKDIGNLSGDIINRAINMVIERIVVSHGNS